MSNNASAKTSVNAAGMTIVEFVPKEEELSIPIDNGSIFFTLGTGCAVLCFFGMVASFFFL